MIGPVRFSHANHDSGPGHGVAGNVHSEEGTFATGSSVRMLFCSFMSGSFGTAGVHVPIEEYGTNAVISSRESARRQAKYTNRRTQMLRGRFRKMDGLP